MGAFGACCVFPYRPAVWLRRSKAETEKSLPRLDPFAGETTATQLEQANKDWACALKALSSNLGDLWDTTRILDGLENMTQFSQHKILIVDDHPLTHGGLRLLFSQYPEFEVVGALDRCEITTAFIKAQPVDIVLLDLNMPQIRGVDILAEIVGSHDMTVIILTGESHFGEIDYALKLGARGVVSKSDPPEEIIAACEAALAGEVYVSPSMREGLSTIELLPISLSTRQMAILHYLAQGETNKEISYRLAIAQPTVSFHMSELRRKLDVPSNRKIVERAQALKLI